MYPHTRAHIYKSPLDLASICSNKYCYEDIAAHGHPGALLIYPTHILCLFVFCFSGILSVLENGQYSYWVSWIQNSIWQSLQASCAAVFVKKHSDLYINRLTFVTGILSGLAEGRSGRKEGKRSLCYLLLWKKLYSKAKRQDGKPFIFITA